MIKNYTQRLEKLVKRRFDEKVQKAILSESFSKSEFGESVKYTMESMREIDLNYTKNTYVAAEKIQKNLTEGLSKKNLNVTYRYQGSVVTNTHIKLHSDIDVLVFTDKYNTVEPPLVANPPYYTGEPLNDLKNLRQESFNVLNAIYNQVDNSNPKAIQVFPTDPKRKVDIVLCNWVLTSESQEQNLEYYNGVHVYDKDKHERKKDFPFLNIERIKQKDSQVGGGLNKLVRLLKTLKADADYTIDLSSFEIQSSVFAMDNALLTKASHQQILLLDEGRKQLDKLITNKNYRENLYSPNQKELVFGTDSSKVVELKKLKLELDELIQDIADELNKKFKRMDESLTY